MEYRELLPDASLRHVVRCYWFLTGDDVSGEPGEPALPDGSPELIINLADPFQTFGADAAPMVQPLTMLVGQITGPFVVGPTGRVRLVAVRFEPHGAAVLCPSMMAITNGWRDLGDCAALDVAALRRALAEAPTDSACAPILDALLQHVVTGASTPDRRVARAVLAIRAAHGVVVQDAIARDAGTTPRTLQRLFATQVGISPKLLARITRFQRVFRSWQQEPNTLARVAAECGYFDQSHLVRDFRDFAGAAPAWPSCGAERRRHGYFVGTVTNGVRATSRLRSPRWACATGRVLWRVPPGNRLA